MISEKWWEGYKFQLQDGNKPFFTFKTADAHIMTGIGMSTGFRMTDSGTTL